MCSGELIGEKSCKLITISVPLRPIVGLVALDSTGAMDVVGTVKANHCDHPHFLFLVVRRCRIVASSDRQGSLNRLES